jgi:hypothetical protein
MDFRLTFEFFIRRVALTISYPLGLKWHLVQAAQYTDWRNFTRLNSLVLLLTAPLDHMEK